MKDIANSTGLSQSTVSIVLRGLSEKRHIPEETRRRVEAAAAELGYVPNASAKRLRSETGAVRTLAIFWANDFRAEMVSDFFQGVYQFAVANAPEDEIIICPYEPGKLSAAATAAKLSTFAGAIICNASEEDLAYLDALENRCPIVIYNRHSGKYSYVEVDNAEVGRFAAEKLMEDGCREMILISDRQARSYLMSRIEGFTAFCAKNSLPMQTIFTEDPSIIIGRECAENLRIGSRKAGIFVCSSEHTSFGLLSGLTDRGIRIPDQVELISIATGNKDLYACLSPKLSVIRIPLRRMAGICAGRLHEMMEKRELVQKQITVPFQYFAGETTTSCGT